MTGTKSKTLRSKNVFLRLSLAFSRLVSEKIILVIVNKKSQLTKNIIWKILSRILKISHHNMARQFYECLLYTVEPVYYMHHYYKSWSIKYDLKIPIFYISLLNLYVYYNILSNKDKFVSFPQCCNRWVPLYFQN